MHKLACALALLAATPVMGQQIDFNTVKKYSETITADDLKQRLYFFASPFMEGRNAGSEGEHKAAAYIASQFKASGLLPGNGDSYLQPFSRTQKLHKQNGEVVENTFNCANVIGIIPGTDKKEEYVMVTAHYDHVGLQNGTLHPGADDDGSGSMAVVAMAEAMSKAVADGHRPRRTIVFMTVSGEEKGLWGSEYYTDHPLFPLAKTVVDLNTDMIGRIGDLYLTDADSTNYLYVIGDDRLSTDLRPLNELANKQSSNLKLDYRYNGDDPERFYYRSDHFNFAKNGVPVIFYFNGVHADYHRPGDTPDKINYPLYAKRARLIFTNVWQIANREAPLKRDLKLDAGDDH
ncbi:Peptidase family M28 [bacterium A37T11]|nr:Peptidase family M28 [bacterium A37T11]